MARKSIAATEPSGGELSNQNIAEQKNVSEIADNLREKIKEAQSIGFMLGQLTDVDCPDGTHSWAGSAIWNLIDEADALVHAIQFAHAARVGV